MIEIVTFGGKFKQLEKNVDGSKISIIDIDARGQGEEQGQGQDPFQIWLSHIISKYDSLADYTLFLTDDPIQFTKFKDAEQLLSVLKVEPSLFCDKTQWCNVLKCNENGTPHHPGLPLKQWFTKLFPSMSPPLVYEFVQGGHVLMSKRKIMSHPLVFYQYLLKTLTEGDLSRYILERLWGYL